MLHVDPKNIHAVVERNHPLDHLSLRLGTGNNVRKERKKKEREKEDKLEVVDAVASVDLDAVFLANSVARTTEEGVLHGDGSNRRTVLFVCACVQRKYVSTRTTSLMTHGIQRGRNATRTTRRRRRTKKEEKTRKRKDGMETHAFVLKVRQEVVFEHAPTLVP